MCFRLWQNENNCQVLFVDDQAEVLDALKVQVNEICVPHFAQDAEADGILKRRPVYDCGKCQICRDEWS